MSVDISVSITEDIVDIIATPTVNIVNVTNSASIDPSLYDLSEFTNTSPNPFVRTSGLSSYVPTSRTLTINGVTQDLSADRTFTIATGLTVGTTPIASGTIGRVLFQGTGNVLQQSSSLSFDSATNLLTSSGSILIGSSLISASAYPLQVVGGAGGSALFSNSTRTQAINFNLTTAGETRIYTDYFLTGVDQKLILGTFANRANQLVLNTTGNVGINTTTDAGFRLDVNGTARVQGLTTLSGTMTASGAIARNQLINGTLVAAANGDTLVGVDINPTFTNGAFTGVTNYGIRSYLNISGIYDGLQIRNTAAAANAQSRIKFDNDITPTQTSTGGVIFYTSSAFSGFPSNSFGLWNYNSSGVIALATNATERMRIFSTGNVGINTTTDAGFRLDVNGTARTGAATIQTLTVGLGTGSQSHNTVLGLSALSSNTSGNFNVAIGPSSLFSNTTGTGNIGIGHFSAVQISNGTNNIAIGREALSNGNSSGNVVVGMQACNVATGSNNVVLGLQAQAGNFSGSVVLGRAATADGNNQFVVGSTTYNAGIIDTATVTPDKRWIVKINGVNYYIALQTV